ncbi:MAG: thiamine pyrophosphate-binding protein, partial [Kiritimatiellae bacterium]|nr:thiamine pyrophosphate-binding protein [Kiritimatiellia bacterium]
MKRRVADIIMDDLADLGVRQAFAVVGGGSMYLSHALGISKCIKTIYCHHEQACAMAAEGYARY